MLPIIKDKKPTTRLQYCDECKKPIEKDETRFRLVKGAYKGALTYSSYHEQCFLRGTNEIIQTNIEL